MNREEEFTSWQSYLLTIIIGNKSPLELFFALMTV